MPKVIQSDTKMEAKIDRFSNFFKKYEKYEIKPPLRREHDFTGSGYQKMHENSILNRYKIDARKSFAKSMEMYAKIEAKWRPRSLENPQKIEKRHGENRC